MRIWEVGEGALNERKWRYKLEARECTSGLSVRYNPREKGLKEKGGTTFPSKSMVEV